MSATRIVIKVNQQAARQYVTAPYGPVYQYVEAKAEAVAATARRLAQSASGTLRSSIAQTMYISGMNVFAQVGSRLPYAIFIHEGTGIYGPRHAMIYPLRGRYLVFTPSGSSGAWGQASAGQNAAPAGGKVFARAVRGVPSNPFLYNALVLELPGWTIKRIPATG